MIRYIGILEKEPGTLWGVWFPDLVGCTTAAETVEDVLERASSVLRLWFECEAEDGRTPPPPRGIDVLRQDPEVAEALAAGHAAVLIAAEDDVLFDEKALDAIDAAASREGLTRQGFIRSAIDARLAG